MVYSHQLKKVSDLTFNDFLNHPLWSWAETDDESLVMPFEGNVVDWDHDAVFLLANLILEDNTIVPGVVSVAVGNHTLYVLNIPDSDGKLIHIPLQKLLREETWREDLAALLNRPIDKVFPIRYKTELYWEDGAQIQGIITQDYVYPPEP